MILFIRVLVARKWESNVKKRKFGSDMKIVHSVHYRITHRLDCMPAILVQRRLNFSQNCSNAGRGVRGDVGGVYSIFER